MCCASYSITQKEYPNHKLISGFIEVQWFFSWLKYLFKATVRELKMNSRSIAWLRKPTMRLSFWYIFFYPSIIFLWIYHNGLLKHNIVIRSWVSCEHFDNLICWTLTSSNLLDIDFNVWSLLLYIVILRLSQAPIRSHCIICRHLPNGRSNILKFWYEFFQYLLELFQNMSDPRQILFCIKTFCIFCHVS